MARTARDSLCAPAAPLRAPGSRPRHQGRQRPPRTGMAAVLLRGLFKAISNFDARGRNRFKFLRCVHQGHRGKNLPARRRCLDKPLNSGGIFRVPSKRLKNPQGRRLTVFGQPVSFSSKALWKTVSKPAQPGRFYRGGVGPADRRGREAPFMRLPEHRFIREDIQ